MENRKIRGLIQETQYANNKGFYRERRKWRGEIQRKNWWKWRTQVLSDWKIPIGVYHNRLKTALTNELPHDISEHREKEDPTSIQEVMLINSKNQEFEKALDFLRATLEARIK